MKVATRGEGRKVTDSVSHTDFGIAKFQEGSSAD